MFATWFKTDAYFVTTYRTLICALTMKLTFVSVISIAVTAFADDSFYLVNDDISCTFHESGGRTHCQKGHIYDAPTVCVSHLP